MQEGEYVMHMRKESQPPIVSKETKQVGEAQSKWDWVEPSVWTERMLTALEQGVKGGKWFSLIDKVYSMKNLQSAFQKVKRNKGAAGVDHITIDMFEKCLEENLVHIHRQLKEETYVPQSIRRKMISKSGKKGAFRPLGIPTVRDRVVQTSLRNVLEPIFEKDFAEHSYGFRPGRGCKDALRRLDALLKNGYTYVVDADLQSYFDTIPHDKLLQRIGEKISDNRIIRLIECFLKQEIMDGMENWTPETGSPQGAVISPLLSNIYLDPLDHEMEEKGFEMVRYADDTVILCRSEAQAVRALELLKQWVEEAVLKLHSEKTGIVHAIFQGFDFLGYRFVNRIRIVSKKSIRMLKNRIRAKTGRSRGNGIGFIITDVNRTLKGWFEYFKHSRPCSFRPLDGWIRMRLRSILRKHNKMKLGAWAGENHIRWPNAFFVKHGLFSLVTARELASQSSLR